MKKPILFFIALLFLGACKKDISDINTDTKKPSEVPAGPLFSYATKQYVDAITSASVNTNVFRFTVSHWAMVTYQDEAQYDFSTRAIPQAWWTIMYVRVLQNLNLSKLNIMADPLMDAGIKTNKLAMIDIMEVLAYSTLVNSFGNVPYSETLNESITFPKYDDAKTISLDLMSRLNNDITALKTSSAGFSASEDLIFGGNIAKWITFANTLRLQQGMILADVDNATAKTAVEASSAAAISSATDNASFAYLAGAPNQNPLFVDIVTGGRGDYVAAEDLLNKMKGSVEGQIFDPRLKQYFTTNADGNYVGGVVGQVNTISAVSKPAAKAYAANLPTLILDYVEAEFFRAEAVERGYTVGGTAKEHYDNAITASILYWGGTNAEATAYLAQPTVNYTTAAGTWREKIGTQKWIALYNRPFAGWTELRRLDYPAIKTPVGAKSGFPNRLPYPNNEQQLNGTNYTEAAAAIGGDLVVTKLFWDTL